MSSEQLITEAGKLSLVELERFVAQVIALQAKRKAPSVSAAEAELLQRVNQGIPAPLRLRYRELMARRQAEDLSATEQAELLQLTEQIENLEYERARGLSELARLRGTTLSDLMRALGLQTATPA